LLVNNKEELKACLQNNAPCVKLIASINTLPADFSCGLGLECGREDCKEYVPDRELWLEEIQTTFK